MINSNQPLLEIYPSKVRFLTQEQKNQWFIAKSRKIYGNKYTYNRVKYTIYSSKIELICNLHGGAFWQEANRHLENREGCPLCKQDKIDNNRKSTNQFIDEANKKHNNKYDYSKVIYKNIDTKVEIVCPEHGSFFQTPYKHLSGQNCPKCSKVTSTSHSRKSTEQFIEDANKRHGNIYCYDKVIYINAFSKVEIICPIHGSFFQTPNVHLKGRGCPDCAISNQKIRQTKPIEQFIEESISVHGTRYNYSNVNYYGARYKVEIICNKHGSFKQEPIKHISGQGCPKCSSSLGESLIRSILESLNTEYIEQYNFNKHPDLLRGKSSYLSFDFYLPKYNLCIEYDGIQHFEEISFFSTSLKSTMHRDSIKNQFCLDNDVRLVRIPYWVNPTKEMILFYLNQNSTVMSIKYGRIL